MIAVMTYDQPRDGTVSFTVMSTWTTSDTGNITIAISSTADDSANEELAIELPEEKIEPREPVQPFDRVEVAFPGEGVFRQRPGQLPSGFG